MRVLYVSCNTHVLPLSLAWICIGLIVFQSNVWFGCFLIWALYLAWLVIPVWIYIQQPLGCTAQVFNTAVKYWSTSYTACIPWYWQFPSKRWQLSIYRYWNCKYSMYSCTVLFSKFAFTPSTSLCFKQFYLKDLNQPVFYRFIQSTGIHSGHSSTVWDLSVIISLNYLFYN